MEKLSLEPTKRTLPNGKVAIFYSPAQVEAIVPVEQRLPRCNGNSMQPDYFGHYRKPHITGEWNCTSKD